MIYHLDSLCYVYEIDWSRVMIINSSKVNMIPIGGEVYSIQLYVVKFVNDICTDGTFSQFLPSNYNRQSGYSKELIKFHVLR
jgi:hypothetical protein